MRYMLMAAGLLAIGTVSAVAQKALISTDGTDPRKWDLRLDGPVAAPAIHKVVWEDSEWRVIDVSVPPGATEPAHLHARCAVLIFAKDMPRVVDRDAAGKAIQAPWVSVMPLPGRDPHIPFVGLQPPQAVHSI